jgi:1-aminocyclopropane-1-carboxylate deaminase/D-cysteine desulfhydrase-like pyridoxal-dependent ACC family enzyme
MKRFFLLLNFFLMNSLLQANNQEKQTIEHLKRAVASFGLEDIFADLTKLISNPEKSDSIPYASGSNELFNYFPSLKNVISYVSLGNLPTPIHHAKQLEQKLPCASLYIKLDNLTGDPGGNKVRKLEFLLADALAHNVNCVITFGCVGSNHALATAAYAHKLGLSCILMLQPQANSRIVQRNLLLDSHAQAEMVFAPTNKLRALSALYQCLHHKLETGTLPYVIPTGGSCALGILGYVNAAFELKKQIEAQELPEPDRIYVPLGSCGTFVGLLLGLKAAGIKSTLVGVAVEPDGQQAFIKQIRHLFEETNLLLHQADKTFPLFECNESDFVILDNFAGKGYALFTQEGVDAIKLLQETEDIILDGVYTAKAFSGFLHDIKHNNYQQHSCLFWNTFWADNSSEITSHINYKTLPKGLHPFFEDKPLQETLFN